MPGDTSDPQDDAKIRSERKKFWIGLGVLVAVAVILRSIKLFQRPFTSDEVYEIRHMSPNLLEIARDPDDFPPLFRWLLSLDYQLLGDVALRSFPAVMGVLVVVVVGITGRQLASNRVGWAAALWCALSSHQIDQSQQCRSYSIYLLSTAIAMLYAFRLRQSAGFANWCGLLLGCFCSLMSHYYALFFVAEAWLLAAILTRKQWMRLVLAAIAMACISVPWVLCLQVDLSVPVPPEHINPLDWQSLAYTYYTLALGWTVGPSQTELLDQSLRESLMQMLPLASLCGISTLAILWGARKRLHRIAYFACLSMVILTPVVCGIVAYVMESTFVGRYVAWIAIPFAILVGAGMQFSGISFRTAATYILLVVNLYSTYNRLYEPRYIREDYDALVQYLKKDAKEMNENDFELLLLGHYMGYAVERILPPASHLGSISLGSDEPDDWLENLESAVHRLGSQPYFYIATERIQSNDIRVPQRDLFLESVHAKYMDTISNTIFVLKGESEALRQYVKQLKNEKNPNPSIDTPHVAD